MRHLRAYAIFERGIAAVLTLGMAVVIVLATISFLFELAGVTARVDPELDYQAFQILFDRVLAAIIALELAHSVRQMVAGRSGLVQMRTVIVIGVLAIVRKFILLDIATASGALVAGLAAAILALGAVYALMHWIEDRTRTEPPPSPGAE